MIKIILRMTFKSKLTKDKLTYELFYSEEACYSSKSKLKIKNYRRYVYFIYLFIYGIIVYQPTNKVMFIIFPVTTVSFLSPKTRFNSQSFNNNNNIFISFSFFFFLFIHKPSHPQFITLIALMADDIVAAIHSLLRLVRDVTRRSAIGGFTGAFKKDCTDLSRRIGLLSHLFEEIRDYQGDLRLFDLSASSSSSSSSLCELTEALKAAKQLILLAGSFDHNTSTVNSPLICACW